MYNKDLKLKLFLSKCKAKEINNERNILYYENIMFCELSYLSLKNEYQVFIFFDSIFLNLFELEVKDIFQNIRKKLDSFEIISIKKSDITKDKCITKELFEKCCEKFNI